MNTFGAIVSWGLNSWSKIKNNSPYKPVWHHVICFSSCSAPKPAPPVESQSVQAEPVEDVDESCRLSMSEKLALFTKLSLPGKKGSSQPDGPPERRRQKGARYRTQPITVEEGEPGKKKNQVNNIKINLFILLFSTTHTFKEINIASFF